MQKFPSWRYHKTEKAKIIHSQEEHDELEVDGWVDSPAKFEQSESSIEGEEIETPADESEDGEEMPPEDSTGPIEHDELEEKSEDELRAMLLSQGVSSKKLKGKSKAALIKMVEG